MKIKSQFPIFKHKINGKPLIYLDNAATTQKTQQVINAITKFYETQNANINRGIYHLSEQATELYEQARSSVARFINASSSEIIFTRNCTESINLIAYTWGQQNIKAGDEIIISALEHHANLVPWQELTHRKKAKLKVIPLKPDFTLDLTAYKKLLTKKTKLVAITGMSNVIGTIPPLKQIITEAHKHKALVLVDAAQSAAHSKTDIKSLKPDFLTFSAHKMFGPTGVGILYARKELLDQMPPFLFGGDMIRYVEQFKSTYTDTPHKFEAGTPNIADVIATAAAIEFIQKIGITKIADHERQLLKYARQKLSKIPELTLLGPTDLKKTGGIFSFTIKNLHPHDIAQVLDQDNICIRAGHHCAHPLMKTLNQVATARVSFSIYNNKSDIDRLVTALTKAIKIFA